MARSYLLVRESFKVMQLTKNTDIMKKEMKVTENSGK
jgi:hypothetical protein